MSATISGPIHFMFMTPAGRPFLSRKLCDLGAQVRQPHRGTSDWARVDCPGCLAAGSETVDAVLALPDAALVALGAWVEETA